MHIQKKVIRLITGIKNMNPVDRNFKKQNSYGDFTVCFTSFVLCKEV